MAERVRLPLVFGQGLDRETGVMAVRPASFEDLRNVYLHQGKALVRRGLEPKLSFLDDESNPLTHILAGHPLRSERVGIVVGYNQNTGKVFVYRIDNAATTAELLGTWFTLAAGSDPPRVIMAEVYGRVFMAHDELRVADRAETFYYDPFSTTPLQGLSADLDGTGAKPVRFRGVVRHLAYLFGWGFGTDSEDRPELVRASLPGDPVSFQPEHYFIAGNRRDPVMACAPAGDALLVFKETETHAVVGYDRATFGIKLSDPLFGVIASRLVVNVSGVCFFWSAEGPRVAEGPGPSTGVELPLDLQGFEPSTLVAEGNVEDAFAHYIPVERVVVFVFGRRVYALTVRVPGDWKWSYWELGIDPFCAFTLRTGGQALTAPPTGHPEFNSATAYDTSADVVVDNVGQDGDEFLEIWLQPTGGNWYLAKTVQVSSQPQQTENVTGLPPGTGHQAALRYRRGPFYTQGYESSDPSQWPSVSRGSFTTTLSAPTVDSTAWTRVSATTEKVTVTVTPAHPGVDVEIYRGTTLIHTETAPQGQFTYDDVNPPGETNQSYKARHVTAEAQSPDSNVVVQWVGPEPGPTMTSLSSPTAGQYDVAWTNGDASLPTEIWDDWDGSQVQPFPYTLRDTVAAGGTSASEQLDGPVNGKTITVGVRHKKTQFGVDDFSEFSTGSVQIT